MNKSDIGVYVTVDAVFPAETPNAIAMCAAIAQLSRDDALFTCARINAIVSGFGPQRDNRERQRHAMSMICSPTQIRALDEYAARHGGAERVMVFFRGQLLELARWVARYGENEPGDGETFADPAVRSSFLRAALIASGLWEQRLFGIEGRKPSHDPREQLRRALGAFRKSVEEANRAPHPGFAISRGWLLFSQYLPARLPRFADLFRAATGLTIQQHFVSASRSWSARFLIDPRMHEYLTRSMSRATRRFGRPSKNSYNCSHRHRKTGHRVCGMRPPTAGTGPFACDRC